MTVPWHYGRSTQNSEEMISRLYRRFKVSNYVPSRDEAWEDGERTKDIPIERVIGDPTFRSSHSVHLLQMADLIAHALFKQEEEPSPRVERLGIVRAFGTLDSRSQPQGVEERPPGVVRR